MLPALKKRSKPQKGGGQTAEAAQPTFGSPKTMRTIKAVEVEIGLLSAKRGWLSCKCEAK